MAWGRKRTSDGGASESLGPVEIFTSGSGMIVEGSTTAVSAFIDQMVDATRQVGGRSRHIVADGGQVAANIAAFRATHREYFEFSERSLKLLRDHGAIPAKDGGFFRSIVHNGKNIAGQLDWKPVNLGPEQALSLQAAAGQFALRAAIKEVTVALDRIEGKIDRLARLADAERLGAAVADRATLQPLVDRARSSGKLSSTDWATVASLGPLIVRDVETLRAYILRQLKDVRTDSPLVRSRVGEVEDLTGRLIEESMALLVVAEQNYTLWQELRLAHAVNHEPAATASVTSDVRQQLAALTQADQGVVELLRHIADRLASPTGYEGLAPLQKRRLREHVGRLDEMGRWFCEQRTLDDTQTQRPELAQLPDSLRKVGGTIAGVARTTGRAIATGPHRLRRRSHKADDVERDGPPKLTP
ncbi:MAG: hypothetical protein Q8K58_13580 [Acidimicrobiales bacterium]|nr:hypothetical protein [Acidimicrobiales bacterium]